MKILQILILIFGASIFANAQKSLVSGTLLDQAGAIFPATTIQIENESNKIIRIKSDREGKFSVSLPNEIFTVSAEAEVNSTLYRSKKIKVEIKDSKEKRLDLTLFCVEGNSNGKCPVVEVSYCN